MKTLLEQTLDLLRSTSATVPEISRATGLNARWSYRLRDGDYLDPGVLKIEMLHRYLAEKVAKQQAEPQAKKKDVA